jgi:hypothetical protein
MWQVEPVDLQRIAAEAADTIERLRHDLARALANHTADLNADQPTAVQDKIASLPPERQERIHARAEELITAHKPSLSPGEAWTMECEEAAELARTAVKSSGEQ